MNVEEDEMNDTKILTLIINYNVPRISGFEWDEENHRMFSLVKVIIFFFFFFFFVHSGYHYPAKRLEENSRALFVKINDNILCKYQYPTQPKKNIDKMYCEKYDEKVKNFKIKLNNNFECLRSLKSTLVHLKLYLYDFPCHFSI